MAYWDGNAWVDIRESCPSSIFEQDLDSNKFTTSICHLSQFALLGEQMPLIYLPLVFRQ
jgi:hypothetical protein